MRRYSAAEAIGPAWEHTKALVWQDRNWKRLLKLSLVAIGAELGNGFNLQLNGMGDHGSSLGAAVLAILLLLFAVLGLVLYVLILYLGSRLQLTQFDILVLRNPLVAPAWERHGPQTWRWAGLKFVILLGSLVLCSPLLLAMIPAMIGFVHQVDVLAPSAGTAARFALPWRALSLLFAEILAIVLVVVMLERLVTSLVLPGVAMENLRFGPALSRAWQIFTADVPGMLLFAVVQPLFLLVIGIPVLVGMVLALAALALLPGLIGLVLWLALHKTGAVAWLVVGTYGALAAIVVLGAWTLLYLAVVGTLLNFSRLWSLYFLGGRYPLLGQYLEPDTVAVPVWTPPPSLPRDDDDSSGPDLPGDPVLA